MFAEGAPTIVVVTGDVDAGPATTESWTLCHPSGEDGGVWHNPLNLPCCRRQRSGTRPANVVLMPRSMRFAPSFLVFPATLGLLGLVACGGTTADDTTSACPSGQPAYARGFVPATPVDFVGLRTETATLRTVGSGGSGADAPSPRPAPPAEDGGVAPSNDAGTTTNGYEALWAASFSSDQAGTLCGGASDRPTCEKKVAELRLLGDQCANYPIVTKDVAFGEAPSDAACAPSPSGPSATCVKTYWLYTRGDEVGWFTNRSEALVFFGVIDAPEEALVLAALGGELVSCSSRWSEAPGGGYDIVVTASRRVRVLPDGTASVLP